MKKFEYKEISLGGIAGTITSDRAKVLTEQGTDGWRLISTFNYHHGEGPNFIELRGLMEREVNEILLGSGNIN